MSLHSEDAFQPSSDSFWEIGQYKNTVKRIDDAHKLCNDLMALIQDRSEIEKNYAKGLTNWSKKWNDTLQKGPEYSTMLGAWRGCLTEAETLADLHLGMRDALMTEVYPDVKQWQKDHFHKNMMGFKETKEMDDGFRKAQKPWAKKYEKLVKSKKDFHTSSKNERSAKVQQTNAKADTSLSLDQMKKVNDKVDKLEREVATSRDKYQAALDDINSYNAKYMEDMKEVYNKCQDFEEKRLKFFKEKLFSLHRCLDLSSTPDFPKVYTDLHSTISTADFSKDLKWWSQNHGTNMPMSWPAFEEWSPEMKQIASKRQQGTYEAGTDGITLKRRTLYNDSLPPQDAAPASQPQPQPQPIHVAAPAPAPVVVEEVRRQEPEVRHTQRHVSVRPPTEPEPENPFDEEEEENGEGDDFFNDDGRTGVAVVALYDYAGIEEDELSFKVGELFERLEDEDEQGWCKGRLNGKLGLYPANYAREADNE